MVTRAAHADWHLQRTQRGFDATMAELYESTNLPGPKTNTSSISALTADQRQLDRARQQMLQDYREPRAAQPLEQDMTPKEAKPPQPEPAPLPKQQRSPGNVR